jgi:predicted porin
MSKVILTLTMAGLVSGAAFAQSKFDSGLSTTIYDVKAGMYGVADVGYCYARGGAGFTQSAAGVYTPVDATPGVSNTRTFSGLQNGVWKNSRLGFNAEENLGHGLKALALMEFAVTVPLATGLSTTRQAYAGLDSSDYGRITLGKLEVASTDAIVRNSALEAITCSPITTLERTVISSKNLNGGTNVLTTMVTGAAAWWNNAIGFQSRTYNGFSGRAFYSFGETGEQANGTGLAYSATGSSSLTAAGANTATAGSSDNERVSAGINYAKGPLNLDLVYQGQLKIRNSYPVTGTATNKLEGGSINEWYFGGSYDFKWLKVMATYQTTASSLEDATIGQLGEKLWSAGAILPVSRTGKVRLEYAHVQFRQGAIAQPVPALQRNGGSGSWGLGYTNELSKHTTVYTILTRTMNDMNSIEQDVNGTGVDVRGASNTMVAAGVSFAF